MKHHSVPMFGAMLATFAVVLTLGACTSPASEPATKPADLVLRNGKIATVDARFSIAQALAVRGDRIAAVGSDADIARWIGPATRVIDLDGRFAMPGFIEGHGHFLGLGETRDELDLRGAKTWDEIAALVAERAKSVPPGEWIRGRGWHQEKWTHTPSDNVGGMPTHVLLSAAAPDHPVLLVHASGHASIVNQEALDLSRIDATTADPSGGTIVKDARGQPTGVLLETAEGLVNADSIASASDRASRDAIRRRWIDVAAQECLAKGVTTFQDAGTSFEVIELYMNLVDAHELPIRMWAMVNDDNERLRQGLDSHLVIGRGGGFLTVRGIKRVIDGALGSRGAWLLEPYADQPSTSGLNTTSLASLRETAELAHEHGYQLCVHAIGDRANRETLDLFESVLGSDAKAHDLRWRIEHAQHVAPVDIPRFGELGVIASMQGVHCTSDGPWVPTRLGAARAEEGAYAWRKLMDTGAIISNGTDTPVEDVDPIDCYYASVSRKLPDGTRFYESQRMTREEALRSYTWNAAYAAFEEKIKGSLEVGKLADIVVLSKDILTVPEEEIPTARVVYTIVGGKVAYARQ